MNWTRNSEESMRCAPWTVCRVRVRSVVQYELWRDDKPACVGRFGSFDEAKAHAEKAA
jgi:hypothetical protein